MIFTPITINNGSEDFEERLDLKSKDIIKIVEYIDEEDISQLEENFNSDRKIDLSTKDAESNGDENTAGGLIENENPDNDDREYLNLTDFKNKFGKKLEEVYNVKPLLKSKELIKKKDYIFINPIYIYVMNEILLKII